MPDKRPTRLFEMPGADIAKIEITKPLPETCFVGLTYRLEGTVKVAGIGAPPWVYAEVKPLGAVGEVTYERGLPKPISGEFSIDLRFIFTGDYEVTVLATPAPLPLPVVGVGPVVGKSDTMEIKVTEALPPGAEFEVSNLVISPAEVQVGYPVIISCLVENIGAEAGTKTIECRLEGVKMAEQAVTLQPGESRTIAFEVVPDVAKTYSVSVDGLFGSFDVVEVGVPAYSVAVGVSNPTPAVGEVVSWWADITNIGDAPGAPTVSWYRDGSLISSTTISTINPGATRRIYGSSFSLGTPGVYTLRVEADTAYDEITIEVIGVGADIRLSDLTITPSEVMVGETVYISVVATNWGDASGSRTIICEVT